MKVLGKVLLSRVHNVVRVVRQPVGGAKGSAFMLERTSKHDLEGNGLPNRARD